MRDVAFRGQVLEAGCSVLVMLGEAAALKPTMFCLKKKKMFDTYNWARNKVLESPALEVRQTGACLQSLISGVPDEFLAFRVM